MSRAHLQRTMLLFGLLLPAVLHAITGVEWLSRAPREMREIEAAMAHHGR